MHCSLHGTYTQAGWHPKRQSYGSQNVSKPFHSMSNVHGALMIVTHKVPPRHWWRTAMIKHIWLLSSGRLRAQSFKIMAIDFSPPSLSLSGRSGLAPYGCQYTNPPNTGVGLPILGELDHPGDLSPVVLAFHGTPMAPHQQSAQSVGPLGKTSQRQHRVVYPLDTETVVETGKV